MSIVAKFRKKPVEIQAMRWTPNDTASANRVREWLKDYCFGTWGTEGIGGKCAILLQTLEGVMRVSPGDWIIRGVKGEFYPCKPDIFAATYELVE